MILWGCEAHLLPGRLRIAMPGLRGSERRASFLTSRLGEYPGVRRAMANPDSGRVLILFDPGRVALDQLRQLLDLPRRQVPAPPQWVGMGTPQMRQAALTGAALAGVVAKRALVGPGAIAQSMRAYDMAGLITVMGSYPYLRRGLARLMSRGQINGDLVIGLAGLAATILRENVVGLAALFVTSLSQWLQARTVAECEGQVASLCPSRQESACAPRQVCHSARISQAGEIWTGRWGIWSAGAGLLAGGLTGDWRRALATVIAAAPSAVPLGSTLPLASATVTAARHGVLIRHSEAVAAAARADLVLFTGPNGGADLLARRVRHAKGSGRTVVAIAAPQGSASLAQALREADLAILLGADPSLVHAADVVIRDGNPRRALAFLALARRADRLGRQNQALATGINLIGLLLAATGTIGPLGATLWHNLTTLAVQCNAARLLPRQSV